MADYTTQELMCSRAAKELKNGDVVFVGIGVPSLAVNLANRMHAPGICMIYESGAVGCVPNRLPISIGDPCLVTGSLAVVPMLDVFNLYLQRGLIGSVERQHAIAQVAQGSLDQEVMGHREPTDEERRM